MTVMEARDTRIRNLEERISVLEQVCAEAYQLAGAVGAPERVLDNLAAAAEGRPIPAQSFLRCPRPTAATLPQPTRPTGGWK